MDDVQRAKERGIRTKTWHNSTCFMCPHCPYDSMLLSKLDEHIELFHKEPKQAPRETVFITDSKGNKINY